MPSAIVTIAMEFEVPSFDHMSTAQAAFDQIWTPQAAKQWGTLLFPDYVTADDLLERINKYITANLALVCSTAANWQKVYEPFTANWRAGGGGQHEVVATQLQYDDANGALDYWQFSYYYGGGQTATVSPVASWIDCTDVVPPPPASQPILAGVGEGASAHALSPKSPARGSLRPGDVRPSPKRKGKQAPK